MAKFKAGDRVRVLANTCLHDQEIGSIVTLEHMGARNAMVSNRPAWGIVGSPYYISERDIERVESKSIHITTDGKTTHAVLKEGGKVTKRAKAICSPHDEFDFNTGARIAFDRLVGNPVDAPPGTVREVKRPAKVGEWIRVIRDNGGQVKSGTVWKVTGVGGFGLRMGIWCCHRDNYVVLEGYTPEPEKPTYYNGKVVCVDDCGRPEAWTKGRVYVFVDGVTTSDKGRKTSCYKTLEHANGEKGGVWVGAKFIEFKGEA